MPTIDSIISDVIHREGVESNNPADPGGRTKYGISERGNPDLWRNGPPTEAQARERYLQRYVVGPGFDKIPDAGLMAQLVDFGVNSGPQLAIQKLQGVLGVAQDGIIGPATLAAITPATNNLLVAARVRMIGKIVQKNTSQLTWLGGWLNRALEFLR